MSEDFFPSEMTIYLLAILGLLGLWIFHQVQVRSGRIQAVDLFDRSVVRMYIYAAPDEGQRCDVCAKAHGSVFLSSQVGKKGFSPLEGTCKGATPCQGFLIGIYGGWAEARQIVARLQRAPKKTLLRLAPKEIAGMVKGPWRKSVSADTDRVNVHLLQAVHFHNIDKDLAIEGYRFVIEHAKDERHLPFLVPSFLLLMGQLIKAGREDEAKRLIEQFESRFPNGTASPGAPTVEQRTLLESKKSMLWERDSLKVSA